MPMRAQTWGPRKPSASCAGSDIPGNCAAFDGLSTIGVPPPPQVQVHPTPRCDNRVVTDLSPMVDRIRFGRDSHTVNADRGWAPGVTCATRKNQVSVPLKIRCPYRF